MCSFKGSVTGRTTCIHRTVYFSTVHSPSEISTFKMYLIRRIYFLMFTVLTLLYSSQGQAMMFMQVQGQAMMLMRDDRY